MYKKNCHSWSFVQKWSHLILQQTPNRRKGKRSERSERREGTRYKEEKGCQVKFAIYLLLFIPKSRPSNRGHKTRTQSSTFGIRDTHLSFSVCLSFSLSLFSTHLLDFGSYPQEKNQSKSNQRKLHARKIFCSIVFSSQVACFISCWNCSSLEKLYQRRRKRELICIRSLRVHISMIFHGILSPFFLLFHSSSSLSPFLPFSHETSC